MRKWTTNPQADTDTRLTALELKLYRQGAPCWVLNLIRRVLRYSRRFF